jgi:hypothetical protein
MMMPAKAAANHAAMEYRPPRTYHLSVSLLHTFMLLWETVLCSLGLVYCKFGVASL